jgi:hypothetical protein
MDRYITRKYYRDIIVSHSYPFDLFGLDLDLDPTAPATDLCLDFAVALLEMLRFALATEVPSSPRDWPLLTQAESQPGNSAINQANYSSQDPPVT